MQCKICEFLQFDAKKTGKKYRIISKKVVLGETYMKLAVATAMSKMIEH